jgi:hypothetical protein
MLTDGSYLYQSNLLEYVVLVIEGVEQHEAQERSLCIKVDCLQLSHPVVHRSGSRMVRLFKLKVADLGQMR